MSVKRWPFDWQTPFGYFVAWLGQCTGIGSVVITVASLFGIVFGSNWLFIVMADDVTNDLVAFNNTVSIQNDSDTRMMEQFCVIIQNYMDAKQ